MEPDPKFQVNTDEAINCKVDLCELFKQMSEEKQEEFVRLIFGKNKKITIHFDSSTVLDEILKIQNGESEITLSNEDAIVGAPKIEITRKKEDNEKIRLITETEFTGSSTVVTPEEAKIIIVDYLKNKNIKEIKLCFKDEI